MCYTYDSLNRVTKREINKFWLMTVSEESFTYDAAGNVTDALDSCFAYDTNNRLTSFNGNAVSYDLDGNMLSNGSLSCTYDSANRLVSAGGMTSSPAYGAITSSASKLSANCFSFSYFGALISLLTALQIIAR